MVINDRELHLAGCFIETMARRYLKFYIHWDVKDNQLRYLPAPFDRFQLKLFDDFLKLERVLERARLKYPHVKDGIISRCDFPFWNTLLRPNNENIIL